MKKIIASPQAPKAVGPYSQAVETGGTLYVSGQLPIDGATGQMAQGVEAQTRKLFKVCAMRGVPIFTFINKMDREARDPYELLEDIENELGIGTYAVNWRIGSGKRFTGW